MRLRSKFDIKASCRAAFKVHDMYNNKGFTLIELMVTISVAAIIMAIAVPSMQTMHANSRVSSVANDLAADLKKARNAAILARRNHTFAAVDSSGKTKWGNNGWRVTEVVAGVTTDVFSNSTVPNGVTVSEENAISVVFSASSGMLQTVPAPAPAPAPAPTSMAFQVCDSQSTKETGYNVLINQFGRVLIQRHASSVVCNPPS